MSSTLAPLVTPDGLPVRPLHRDEYFALAEAGVFEDENVELLDGMVVPQVTEGPPHAILINELTWLLTRGLPAQGWRVSVGHPFLAGEYSVPEPDVAIIPKRPGLHHPREAALLIECAYSSHSRDLGRKARIYAGADAPTYWVADMTERVTHVHTSPRPDGYADVMVVPFADTLVVLGIDVVMDDLEQPTS